MINKLTLILIFISNVIFSQPLNVINYKKTIAAFESKNQYTAINRSSNAVGKYQFIYKYIPKQYKCKNISMFLQDRENQEKLMNYHINKTLPECLQVSKKYKIHIFYVMSLYHWLGPKALSVIKYNKHNKYINKLKPRFIYYEQLN